MRGWPGSPRAVAGDVCLPGPGLAAAVAELSGPEWRCAGATDEELIGLLGRWDAIGSWAKAGKLGVVRELLFGRARPALGGAPPVHGDLPDQWEEGAGHEVSAALAISLRSADNLTAFAWDLQGRLPGVGAALADGTLTPVKARIISDELKVLDDEHAAQAEKLILDQLDGQTPAQLGRLAAHAVVDGEPGRGRQAPPARRAGRGAGAVLAGQRRRVRAGRVRPARRRGAGRQRRDQRPRRGVQEREAAPDARMDQLRVLAFLDILNGITLRHPHRRRPRRRKPRRTGARRPAPAAMAAAPATTRVAAPAVPAQTAPAAVTFPPATATVQAARTAETGTAAPAARAVRAARR